jgi:two-component system response regulator GlrR
VSEDFDSQTEVQANASLSTSVIRRPRTLVWTDADGAHAVPLEGRMILGSSQHAPLRVNDRAVSRVHAELEAADDGIWLRDLGSRNGSWVEGVLCKLARVEGGARIRVGNVTLQVRVEGAEATVPLWPYDRFGDLVARSEVMRELFMRLSQYAQSDASVLVQGETGTGKELVARALHQASPRSTGPFVVVDCGALPENLLETELFGHARGAFTGAANMRIGAIESADGGTVFLDEIGELPLAMQPKLLRVLESKTVRRVGETEHRTVDVRFLSATHRDLQQLVASGAFREDLYFRLSVLPAHVPPLRSRPADVPLLVAHFLRERAPGVVLDPQLEQEVTRHPWLGNVRELRSFVDRVATIGPDAAWALTRGDASAQSSRTAPPVPRPVSGMPDVRTDVPFKELRESWTDHLEREYIRKLIEQHGRNLATLAAAAGLDRTYVKRLIQKHSL